MTVSMYSSLFVSAFWTWGLVFHYFLRVFRLKCYILERNSKYLDLYVWEIIGKRILLLDPILQLP